MRKAGATVGSRNGLYSIRNEGENDNSGFGKLDQLLGAREIYPNQMIENCGDSGPLARAIKNGDRDAFTSGAEVCTKEQQDQFVRACDGFERCAGFDFLEFAENNLDDVGRSVFGCLKAFATMSENLEIIEECTALVMQTGLGRSVGYFLEYNEMMCPCFQGLRSGLPECSFQRKDSGKNLDGPAVKFSICLLDEVCKVADLVCRTEVLNLDQCLPSLTSTEDSCEQIEGKCKDHGALLFAAPYPLRGATFPDRCQIVAQHLDLHNSVVGRYNAYRRQCIVQDDTSRDFGSPDEIKGLDIENLPAKEASNSKVWTTIPWLVLSLGIAYGMVLLLGYKRRQRSKRSSSVQMQVLRNNSQVEDNVQRPYKDDFEDEEGSAGS